MLVDHVETQVLQNARKLAIPTNYWYMYDVRMYSEVFLPLFIARQRYNQDLIINLTHERNELIEDLQEQGRLVDKLSEIVQVVEMCARCNLLHFQCVILCVFFKV